MNDLPQVAPDASRSESGGSGESPQATTKTCCEPAWIGSLAWAINVLLLVGLCAWIVNDPRIGRQMANEWRRLNPPRRTELPHVPAMAEANRRTTALQAMRVGVIVSLAVIVTGLFVGAPRHRGVRSWLSLTALVAAWLTVFTTYPSLTWAGQRWRMARQLDAFEAIAAPLRDHWPGKDGSTDSLGPFNAYPIGKPQMLMLLTTPPAAPRGMSFGAIERSPEGALRFQLTGKDEGVWLEWHPAGSTPGAFAGALMVQEQYELERTVALGAGWFVSRYYTGAFPSAGRVPVKP